VSRP
jgi:hypothetical protein